MSVLDAFTYNVSLLQADSQVKDRDLPDELNSTLIDISEKEYQSLVLSGPISHCRRCLIHIVSKILLRYAIANGVV
ncbi:hypothetical protein [Nostoc sp.]|uniref:hypothetical protein n=1 Tax=Nostoc sp. TaxID=1180 RepID=UPI002FF8972A